MQRIDAHAVEQGQCLPRPGRVIEFIVDQPQRASDLLKQGMESWRVSLFGDRLHVITDELTEVEIEKKLEEAGIEVRSARESRFSMEDVFISVVAQAQQRGLAMAS